MRSCGVHSLIPRLTTLTTCNIYSMVKGLIKMLYTIHRLYIHYIQAMIWVGCSHVCTGKCSGLIPRHHAGFLPTHSSCLPSVWHRRQASVGRERSVIESESRVTHRLPAHKAMRLVQVKGPTPPFSLLVSCLHLALLQGKGSDGTSQNFGVCCRSNQWNGGRAV